MDIKTVCLGILSFEDATGYDIKQRFEHTYRHFFAAGYGSIYPALASLAADGLVRYREEPGHGPRMRKVYRLTARGEEELKRRLAEAQPRHRVHSDFMLLMFLAAQIDPERVDAVLEERLAEIRQYVALLEDLNVTVEAPEPGKAFTRGLGLAVLRATARYLEDNRSDFLAALRDRARGATAFFKPTLRGDSA